MGFNELEEYVIKLQNFLENNKLTEEEIVMMVYLDLGLKFKFDKDFFFGGSNKRREMYTRAFYFDTLCDCFKTKQIMCKSVSYILRYILSSVGINIKVIEDEMDTRKYKHVLNLIKPSNGDEEYTIDLQEDIINIHYHAFTKDFGLSKDRKKYIISKEKQRLMHEKFGYISKNNPYVDEYLLLLKYHLSMLTTFKEKIDFVLLNIDPIEYPKVDYFERRWRHKKILEELFVSKDLPSDSLFEKVRILELYKVNEDNEKKFINGFSLEHDIYVYSLEDNLYHKYNIDEFARLMMKENILCNQNIIGLKGALAKINNKEKVLVKEQA